MRRLRKMLMLLSMHVTSVLFLVRFNNFTLTTGSIEVTRSYSSRPFSCALAVHVYAQNFIGILFNKFANFESGACEIIPENVNYIKTHFPLHRIARCLRR